MIDDSIPWREDLLRMANRLSSRMSQRRWTDRTAFLVERDIMISAYAVRRLNEARKISDELAARSFMVRRHALIANPPDMWSRQDIREHFDLDRNESVALQLPAICNQIIHSWIWVYSASDFGALNGIYVSSDRERRKGLYFFGLAQLVNVFTAVAKEDIVEIQMRADDKGERQITRVIARSDIN